MCPIRAQPYLWYYLSCLTGGYPSSPVPNNAIPVHARFEKRSLFHCIWISNLYLSYRTTQIGVWPVRTSTFWPFYLSRTVGQSLRSSPANGSSVKIGQGSHWYNTGQYHMTLYIAPLQWLKQIINQCINSQTTLHNSSSWVRYEVSIDRILEKINRIIKALEFNRFIRYHFFQHQLNIGWFAIH